MRCTSPRTVGFKADGKTISWSQKDYSKQYATFQLPCGKCIDCRLAYAREWAIRCVHESYVHDQNCFITLTYSDENLKSPKLDYRDFQLFMKKLRFTFPNQQIGMFVTGEYGEQNKRPHWHAIIFGWEPSDKVYSHKNHREDKCYSSETLDKIWGKGKTEIGSVTIESAGYCARYAAKKLVHGKDEEHDFHPISKKSSKHAIGKKFLEKFWPDIFSYGRCELNGASHPIPRYYEKWFKQHHPERWINYVTERKADKIAKASAKSDFEQSEYAIRQLSRRSDQPVEITQLEHKTIITKSKFKQLQERLKL